MAEGRIQRRLAAILVADVVGYSRLIEADEEGTRARLRSLLAELIEPRIAADMVGYSRPMEADEREMIARQTPG